MSSHLKGLVCAAAVAGLAAVGLHLFDPAEAGGETRTLRLYVVNTKESLTTTYMVNGRHQASELAKINQLLRDWRRNAVTRMDPKTIDLIWELHSDLGSRAPVHVISGYRSAQTNALLKSIGRNVAKQSMHIQGKAVDLYFPDVSTERLRNSALVREVGGVGYYPRSGVSGFIHVDSGRVRHWPRISQQQMARIFRDYRKTIGARLSREPATLVASAESPQRAVKPVVMVAKQGYPVPTPRPRPIEVLMMAAAQMTIEPAAAPVPRPNFGERPSLVRDTLGPVAAASTLIQPQQSNAGAKGSLVTALRDGIAAGLPVIVPLGASAAGGTEQELLWWPAQLFRSAESLIRRDGTPQPFGSGVGPVPGEPPSQAFPPISDEDTAELQVMIAALNAKARADSEAAPEVLTMAAAKGDRLAVNRASKGDLIFTAPRPRYGLDKLDKAAGAVSSTLVETFQNLLKSSE